MPDVTLREWCANIAWAVTTERGCYGWLNDHGPDKFVIYDASEDDPPIGVFEDRETAERVAEALIRVGREDGTQTPMRLHVAEDWPTRDGALLRRVGWLDQKGRVWIALPPQETFDGGSLTPLLIDIGDD